MRDAVEHALQIEEVIHLIGGSGREAEMIVEEVQATIDSELRWVAYTPDTTAEAIPSARVICSGCLTPKDHCRHRRGPH